MRNQFIIHDRLVLNALSESDVKFMLNGQWIIIDDTVRCLRDKVILPTGITLYISGTQLYLPGREDIEDKFLMEYEMIKNQETVTAIVEAGRRCEPSNYPKSFYVNFLVNDDRGYGMKNLGKGVIIERVNNILSVRR